MHVHSGWHLVLLPVQDTQDSARRVYGHCIYRLAVLWSRLLPLPAEYIRWVVLRTYLDLQHWRHRWSRLLSFHYPSLVCHVLGSGDSLYCRIWRYLCCIAHSRSGQYIRIGLRRILVWLLFKYYAFHSLRK